MQKSTPIKVSTIILIVLLIGALIYLFKDQLKNLFKKKDIPFVSSNLEAPAEVYTNQDKPKASQALPKYNELDLYKVLKKGSRGKEVTALQLLVNHLLEEKNESYAKISVDGIFGNQTLNAIKPLWNVTQTTLAATPILKLYK